MARPKKPAAEVAGEARRVRYTAADGALVDRAAAAAGLKPAVWIRMVTVDAARETLGETENREGT